MKVNKVHIILGNNYQITVTQTFDFLVFIDGKFLGEILIQKDTLLLLTFVIGD